ncbi:MAG: SRPBCC family protein [Ornithinibacter sp.]
MELTHDFTVPADVDTTWATFMDLESVGNCFPGATVTEVNDDGFSGTVKVKLGPIALQYAGSGTFIERDDATHRAVIEAKGKDKRGNGTAGATVTIALTPSGNGTRVDVATDLSITGKPAQFGRGVMQDVSDKLLGQFVTCIENRFAEPAPEAGPDVEAPPEAAAPSEVVAAAASGAAASGATATPAASGARPTPAAARPTVVPKQQAVVEDSIDLGATVLPVLLRSYAPYAVAGLLGALIGFLLGRRRA